MSKLTYKERWVCFTCRKMFRYLRQVADVRPSMPPPSPKQGCSACGSIMINIGSFFAPPARNEKKLWEAARQAAQAGYHCHSLGASRVFWEVVGK